ncbi:hypothetical protein NP233_g3633 [Leucocoprinus birnbaumii]|uniref:Uncharacterized protein n=1 Tax=Leucocoprinus birnbaumii TaxID=56174 RepID=A0AAD5W2Q8_9AGAR|nr:hypothetical protein NP233_g3633 [Leucocoprinus birnbaumii]
MMFRASPWVPYQPSHQSTTMDDDVDMDAPSISTLPEEKTPPPTSRRKADSRKKKPKAAAPAAPFSISWRKSGTQASDGEPAEEGEDEEDQLIDDEDDVATPAPTPASTSAKTTEAAPKKKAPAKRKARKEPGTEEEGAKKRTKKDPSSSTKPRKPSGSEPTPSESLDDGTDAGTGANTPTISVIESEPLDNKTTKKKSTPRKTAAKAAKGKSSGLKMVIPALSSLAAQDDTASVMSEGGVSGTAASSPVAIEKSQPGSPEPEPIAPSSPVAAPAPLAEETNLENVPLPVYPLPSKPFPVQPPPKIPTGFAPPIPLDKSGKKVRHWRTANREIRGIAGGRWFARSWVGDKDSEYGSLLAAKELEKSNGLLGLPKQSSHSASAPPLGRGSSKKTKGGATSVNPSAAPSRDASVVPQDAPPSGANTTGATSVSVSANATPIPIATSTVRAPTKMRIQQLPEDSEAQSDAAMDVDPIPAPLSEA